MNEAERRRQENERIAQRNAEYQKKMAGKYHRVFNTPDGKAVLEDMKRMARPRELIDFGNVGVPFSPERYFVRKGFRQSVDWIELNMKAHEEAKGEDK